MNNESILKQLNWRYAVKRFDPTKKVSQKDWETLEQSLLLAPSSYGLQPWKFIVVQNPELRKKLRAASWNQSQVEDCSHFVVFTTRPTITELDVDRYLKSVSELRSIPLESLAPARKTIMGDVVTGARSKVIQWWAHRQAYIAMGFLMETAAFLNIDTCPFEGLDPAAYDKILDLEGGDYLTVAAVAVGYRHPEDKFQFMKKVRYEKSEIIEYK